MGGEGGRDRVGGGGVSGGCDRRIEVFGKNHKKNRGRGRFGSEGLGGRVGGSGWM